MQRCRDAQRKMDYLWHDGDAFGVDGAEISVFKQADQIALGRLL